VDQFISHRVYKYIATGPTKRWVGQPTPLMLQELSDECAHYVEGEDYCYPIHKPYKTTPDEFRWYTPAEMVGMARLADRKMRIGRGNTSKYEWVASTFYGNYLSVNQLYSRISHLTPAKRILRNKRVEGYRRDMMTTMAAELNPSRTGVYCWTCGEDGFDAYGYHFSHIKDKDFEINRALTANWRNNEECMNELFVRKAVIVECIACHTRRAQKYEHRQYLCARPH
jgi:hypothetical protein